MGAASTVTILFTDLVGSTALATKIGDAAMHRLRRSHFEELRGQLAATGGREVKTIGDALMAVYRGTSDAVSGAVGMQQAVDRMNRRSGEVTLEMRIGISAGDAVEEERDWFGTPVIEAARLCAVATGGQILVADIVRVLAGSRDDHEFTSVGDLTLKGLAAALPTCEVVWAPMRATLPLPQQLGAAVRAPMVGREAELEQLQRSWTTEVDGVQFGFIGGEAGIGKTRLVAELASQLRVEGAVVLFGRCDENITAPFRSIVDALSPLAVGLPAVARAGGASLARLWPELADQVGSPPSADPETERLWLFESVNQLLALASELAPVVLVLDDLQWADDPTLQLLRYVSRSTTVRRMLIIGTYRESEVGRAHPLALLVAELRRERISFRVVLSGLVTSETSSMITALTGATPSADLLAVIQAETEGSPFFVEEVIAHLRESSAVRVEDGELHATTADTIGIGVPEGVRRTVERRVAMLSPAAIELLRVAAVAGREFDLEVVRSACHLESTVALSAMADAIAAGLLTEVAGPRLRYAFSHALIRSSILDELNFTEGVLMHARVGFAIEAMFTTRIDEHVAELARHFNQAALAGEAERAVDYSMRAAENANQACAFEDALVFCSSALRALDVLDNPDDKRRCDVLTKHAAIAYMLNRSADAAASTRAAVALAKDRKWGEELARAAVLESNFVGNLDTRLAGLEVVTQALEMLPADSNALRSDLLSFRAFKGYDAPNGNDDAEILDDLATQALALATGLPDSLPLSRAWMVSCGAFSVSGQVDQMLAAAEEAARIDRRDGRQFQALLSDVRRVHALLRMARRADAEDLMDQYTAPELASTAFGTQSVPRWRAMLALADGRLDDAEAILRSRGGSSDQFDPVHFDQLLAIRWARGDIDRVMDRLGRAFVLSDEFPLLKVRHAAYLAALGDHDASWRAIEHLRPADLTSLLRGNQYQRAAHDLAEIAARLGDEKLASQLCTYLTAHDGTMLMGYSDSTVEGAASRSLAQLETTLGRYDEAQAHFEAAIELETGFGAWALLPDTRIFYARMLRARADDGDAVQASTMLRMARDEANRLGLTRSAAEATALLV